MERFRIVTASIWVAVQLIWLQRDVLIRDGDEEGHVGAAEVVVNQIHSAGWYTFLTQTWWQNLGEYPPLFASYMGAWWSLFASQPEDLIFRAAGIPLILCTAWATSEASKHRDGEYKIAFVLVLCLPLAVGLSRHSMIENMLLPCTALCTWSITQKSSPLRKGIFFGFFFCLGMLSKQTFLITGVGILFLINNYRILYTAIPIVVLGSLGWYLPQLSQQQSYVLQSVASNTQSSVFVHLLAPLSFIFWDILGPAIALFGGYSLFVKKHISRPLLWWILLSLVLFILVPKKYPRLMLAVSIPIILMISDKKGAFDGFALTLAVLWLLLGSCISLPQNPLHSLIDKERCPQVWLRPPFSYDLGLKEIRNHVQHFPSDTIIVLRTPPTIPCSLQTTHDFAYHLEIYLRRHDLEHPIQSAVSQKHAITISWSGDISHPSSLKIQ